MGETAFGEAEKVFTKAQIKFSSFEDLTHAFSIKVSTSARIWVNPATHDQLIAL
jgi:hypothetical protein